MSPGRYSRTRTPLWRQAVEGIGLVVAISVLVGLVGVVLAIVVALIF